MKAREELKKYFETGDFPTESEFAALIDSYAHLNEFNFGLSVRPSGYTNKRQYHFYVADDIQNSGKGHIIVPASDISRNNKAVNAKLGLSTDLAEIAAHEAPKGYQHVLSRAILFKDLEIELVGNIDVEKLKPQIIVERYKQKKVTRNGETKPAGYRQENPEDAAKFNRRSTYEVKSKKMLLNLEPIHYFRPTTYPEKRKAVKKQQVIAVNTGARDVAFKANNFKGFLPSGSLSKTGSFTCYSYNKIFEPIQLKLAIRINGKTYTSQPVRLKIIMCSRDERDAINFAFA